MFTGIVEASLPVRAVVDQPGGVRLWIDGAADRWPDLKPGDSVAVNGACLTVSELGHGAAAFDVVRETLAKTALGELRPGRRAHVERPLRADGRLDGHFVQGHVDGTGVVVEQRADPADWRLCVDAPADLAPYLVPKGSVAVDGVSLTLARVDGRRFEVALIPTTLKLTQLGERCVGERVNLEADVLVKTVVQTLARMGAAR